ncbi:MAG: AraC family transcriptional regulator ligand-binding domain-containing protein [Hyphomicrobiaceae bacterium]|nr:AraC family transcriptional regulator ligand-binding domain-containing protein [Hyphomicrobiaceae bacterium]
MIRAAPAISLAKYFDARKLDFRIVARDCDFPMGFLDDPMATVPLRVVLSLFAAASRATGDRALPIKLAKESIVGETGLLGHLATSAPTVRACLECLAGYMPIFVTGLEVGYVETGATGKLFWRVPIGFDAMMEPFSVYVAAMLILRIRMAAGEGWTPLAVTFGHKAPSVDEADFKVFGNRITFGAETTSFTVDAVTLARPMPTANEQMFAIFKHHASLLLREITAKQDLAAQVRDAIGFRLTLDTPSLEAVARDIGVTPRALQRRLERMGLSFEKVLDETRFTIAERLLRETDRPLIQVAHDVGYGSQSTFTRAVRRWLDVSPRAYRERCRRVVPSDRAMASLHASGEK